MALRDQGFQGVRVVGIRKSGKLETQECVFSALTVTLRLVQNNKARYPWLR
jgi:hypothetical protein